MSDEFVFETQDMNPQTFLHKSGPAEVDIELQQDLKQIPDKMAFKIGEVANLVGIKSYVLRYWESEFDALKPKKSKNNQRMYTRKDVEMVMMIKKLLYRDRFSIEGARTALKKMKTETRQVKKIDKVHQSFDVNLNHFEQLIHDIRSVKNLFN